ncbi:unnamed protein product [Allacma fusca]|uniref:Uncharacterized protein n=1 Tax=Allacma fusca TaxID=39272 RepID=A0A8J2J9R8_9HEXA|nr:unnamed protein product [Allacma fusca]
MNERSRTGQAKHLPTDHKPKQGSPFVQCVVLAGGQTLPLSKFLFVANLEKLNQKIFSDEPILSLVHDY